MATRSRKFQRIRKQPNETVESLGGRLDRQVDQIGQVVDFLSESVSGLGTGASADLSDTPALALASSASAGTSEEASRSDHRHPLPSGSQLRIRQEVTTATVLSGDDDLIVAITATFNGEITLPAASTAAGQTITIIDEVGAGGGAANGADENIIYVEVSDTGTETMTTPGTRTSRTRFMLWKKYASITLVSDGTSAWRATDNSGWWVDPRSISGLEVYYDARKGITLNGSNVSAWADLSGNNIDLSQGTAANQPAYFQESAPQGPLVFPNDTTDTLASSSTITVDSGSQSFLCAFLKTSNNSINGMLFKTNETTLEGFAFFPQVSTNPNSPSGTISTNDWLARGLGTGNAAPTFGPYYAGPQRYATSPNRTYSQTFAVVLSATNRPTLSSRTGATRVGADRRTQRTYTQTVAALSGLTGSGLFCAMLYDAALSANDLIDLNDAIYFTFTQGGE